MSTFPTDAERARSIYADEQAQRAIAKVVNEVREAFVSRAHIADLTLRTVAPLVADRERAAAARALRKAADDLERKANDLIKLADRWGGYYHGLRSGMQSTVQHLRDHAAALEAGEDRG